MSVEPILLLKREGNDFFKAGLKITSKQSPVRKQHFVDACLKYAAALEGIVEMEFTSTLSQHSSEQLAELKPNLFINLGMTNFQLDDFNESRRCCNAAITFINDATLRMNELGEHHDININVSVNLPVHPDFRKMAAKVLFRRAKSLFEEFQYDDALRDATQAILIVSDDKIIYKFMEHVQSKVEAEQRRNCRVIDPPATCGTTIPTIYNESASNSDASKRSEVDICDVTCTINSLTLHLCHNGGLCLMRHAFWSQTTAEVTVHVPVKYLQNYFKLISNSSGDSSFINDKGKDYQIYFKANRCDIKLRASENNDQVMSMHMSYNVLPDESSWFLSRIEDVQYLVLVLRKATPVSIYPGCEWWERVFDEDEKIDTLTCSVGADASQLPDHAQQHAEREHARFQALSSEEREQELEAIRKYKHIFAQAEANTRDKVLAEDRAVQEVPQRAGMLEALRNEFPHIQFSAK